MAIIKRFELLYCSDYRTPQESKIESFGEFDMYLLEHNGVSVSNQSFRLPDTIPLGLFTDERLHGNIFLGSVTNPYAAALQAIAPYMDIVKVTAERALSNCYIVVYANTKSWLYTSIVPGVLGSWMLSAHYNGEYNLSTPFILRYNFSGAEYANIQTSLDSYVIESENGVITNLFGEYTNLCDTSVSTLCFYANPSDVQNAINFLNSVESHEEPKDPYSKGGNSGGGGGKGRFSRTGDTIGEHNVPTLSATDAGFITLFAPTAGEMKALASYLWSDLFSLDTFKKIFANPMDAILGLSIVPVSVPTAGSASVKVGNISTGVSMTKASTQYVKLSCGSLEVEEYWGAYLDYSPYTKCEIYLPYIGVHELSVDDVMGKTVKVVYYIDILSGACTAEIYSNDTCLYSFVGQCSASIPITGNDWTNVINGVMQIGASIGSMVASGGLSAPISGAGVASGLKSVASASSTVTSSKPSVERSGSMSGAGGMLGQQTPYLIITWPRECIPADQNKYIGYPSFVTVNLGEIVGFNIIDSVHLENITATSAELDEIESLLMNGVIF